VLIVGAGHAGTATAIQLRQLGFAGTIGMVGAERDLPYERPPLTKDFLAGTKAFEDILVRPATFWPDRDIVHVPGERVVSVDPGGRTVACASGRVFAYKELVWAAGGRARPLPFAPDRLRGVHSVRERADVDALRHELSPGQRWVVIGGGYIGLEAAAVLACKGIAVTIVENADRVLARVSAAPLSRFVEAEHRAHGVAIRLQSTVKALEHHEGAITGVRLAGGELLSADGLIVGIGILPNAEPLLDAGARGGDGIAVDSVGRTSLPHIWAAGDCALGVHAFGPARPLRIESVGNAADGAAAIARAMTGLPPPQPAPPWFWSNQFDLKLQTIGLTQEADEVILRGDPAARRFAVIYLREGKVTAVDCVNNVRDYVGGRKLIESGRQFDRDRLADPLIPLKSLLEP
jgi:3-phenylpropionate/trans-cinnamate dioxygenase ferredoxin reductase subunit